MSFSLAGSATAPLGAFGRFASRTISLPQLRRLARGDIPWTPLSHVLSVYPANLFTACLQL
jgi:hypothetical protein